MMQRDSFFWLLLLINVAAVFAGAWYYQDQLSATPLPLLLFVPDCPLYVLLAIPILLGITRNPAYSFIVSIGMAKYGLWTVAVLLFHWNVYSLPAFLPVTLIFIFGHLGMAFEGIAILPKKKVGLAVLALALAWFLLNDYVDYFLGTVPPIPTDGMALVQNLTILSSLLLPLLFYLFPEKVRSFPPVKFFRWVLDS